MEENITGKEAVSLEQLKAFSDEVRGGTPATTESYGTVKLISDDDLSVYKSGVGNGADTNDIDIEVTVNHAELVNYPENAEISYTASCVDGTVTINDLNIDTNTSGLFRPQTRYELATVQVGYRPSSLTTIDPVVLWVDGEKYSRWSFKVEVDTDGKIYLQSTDGSGYVSSTTTYTIKTPITYQVAVDPIFASVTDDTVLNIDQTLSLLSGSGGSSEGDSLSGCVELLWEGSGFSFTVENYSEYAAFIVHGRYRGNYISGILDPSQQSQMIEDAYIARDSAGRFSDSDLDFSFRMVYGLKAGAVAPETSTVLWLGNDSVSDELNLDGYSRIECSTDSGGIETLNSPFSTNQNSSPIGIFKLVKKVSGNFIVQSNSMSYNIRKVVGYK